MPGATFNLPTAFAAFGIRVSDGVMTAGGSNPRILTSATAAFTPHDKGKKITVAGAGAAGADLTTRIERVQNGTTVELKDPALTTVNSADLSYVAGVYRLSSILNGPDINGNTYQFMGHLTRLFLSLAADSPGGTLLVGGPYLTDTNFGFVIGANSGSELAAPGMGPQLSPSSDYIASATADQKVHIFWSGDLNQSTGA
jgi:hypothetical protein